MYCLCLSGVCGVQVGIIAPIEDDLYLPLCVLLSTRYSHAHTLFSLGTRLATVLCPSHMKERRQLDDNCGFQVYSLVLQTRPFPSTAPMAFSIGHILKAIGAVEGKTRGSHF